MPKNGHEFHERDQWSQPTRGVTIEETANVTMRPATIEPQVCFRGGMQATFLSDMLYIGPIGSQGRTITVTFGPPMLLSTGCFVGTLDAFEREVRMKPEGTVYRQEYEALIRYLVEMATIRGFAANASSGVPECGLGEADRAPVGMIP